MIFAKRTIEAGLEGAILAHSLRLPGGLIAKGTVLGAQQIASMMEAGISTVHVALLEADDVAEAQAADRLGRLLAVGGLRAGPPIHGRVNLFAKYAGLLRINVEQVAALNALDEAITLATLPDATRLTEGDMVATLKIIPFAVAGAVLEAASLDLAGEPLMRVQMFRPLRVGLVLSRLAHVKESVIEATIGVTRARVQARGGQLLEPCTVTHETRPIAAAIQNFIGQAADIVLIAGASAVTDRGDVAPSAIVASGGVIERFGMPVDPGNLICIGRIGAVPAIVLPGCARSPKLNGIDFVLDRVFASETLDKMMIARMGVGGLLKDFSARPARRVSPDPARATPKIAAIILAAGRSSRAAPQHKLLTMLADGRTMIETTTDHVIAAQLNPVVVVTGHAQERVADCLAGRKVRLVVAEQYELGMAESLKAGIAALPADIDGVLICLGDMPLVDQAALRQIIDAYDPDEGRTIVVPTYRGKRGNPVLWDRRFFPFIAALQGDQGARSLFAQQGDAIAEVAMENDAVLQDFDTIAALEELRLRP